MSTSSLKITKYYIVCREPAATDLAEAWLRGVTPRLRSGVVAESDRLRWCRSGQEELPNVGGQGQQLGGATPPPRSGAVAEEQPHIKGAVAVQVQEGQEELLHVQSQERWL